MLATELSNLQHLTEITTCHISPSSEPLVHWTHGFLFSFLFFSFFSFLRWQCKITSMIKSTIVCSDKVKHGLTWAYSSVTQYRGFALRGMHLCAHDFSKSLGFLLHRAVWWKPTKHTRTFDLLHGRIWNFIWVCVLIFLSLGCNLEMWYELNKK